MLRVSAAGRLAAASQCKKERHQLRGTSITRCSSSIRVLMQIHPPSASVPPTKAATDNNTALINRRYFSNDSMVQLLRRNRMLEFAHLGNGDRFASPTSSSAVSHLGALSIDPNNHRYFSTESGKKMPDVAATSSAAASSDSDDKKKKETASSTDEKKEKAASSPPPPPKTDLVASTEKTDPSIVKKATDATLWALKALFTMLAKTPGVLWFYLTHPKDFKNKLAELKEAAIKEAHHYWMGSKLLAADVRTAKHILGRTLRGSTLSRRERKQLLRTVTDVFRLVPMSIFVLVPFMEFALPFALKLFPNMLPSTFQDSLKEEEKMKGELQMRISMAGFFQDTLTELAKEQKKFAQIRKQDAADASDAKSMELKKEETAASFLEFLKKARTGKPISPDVIIRFSKYFADNLTLDNMGRMQLINMCKYMGIPPYGNDNLLRFQLRHRIRLLKDDDQRILWEGIDSLTKMELREACRERGMRSTGLSKEAYTKALQQWLDLSVQKNVPITLLIMSRAFFLQDEMVSGEGEMTDDGTKSVSGLADAMSGIDKEVLNEIVLDMASSEEKSSNADVMKIQLEVLEHQNELIKEEQQERDAAAKEKAEKEKAKAKAEEQPPAEVEEKLSATKEEPAKEDGRVSMEEMDQEAKIRSASSTLKESISVESAVPVEEGEKLREEEESDEDDSKLSAEEIEAIRQLTSPDPVHREREELQRIKAAMLAEEEKDAEAETITSEQPEPLDDEKTLQAKEKSQETASAVSPCEPFYDEKAQEEAIEAIKEIELESEKEAKDATVISMEGDVDAKAVEESHDEKDIGDVKLQKAIERLKSRVESMVGKIETQLTDVEVKIGNKFHLLDQDRDGVLTMEEMAHVLQTVLKRKLTIEEAMAVAADIDTDKDGLFSITELAEWAETNTIAKLAEDGREKDLDDMITKRVAVFKEKRKTALKEEAEEWSGI
jgi:LETM1 and EF-hand domain-containing protein 1